MHERGPLIARILARGAKIAVHAEPVHLAAAGDFVLADDGDVVLRLAGEDARPAAGARRQVDRHAPLVVEVLLLGPQRGGRRDVLDVLREVGMLFVVGERGLADQFRDAALCFVVADARADRVVVLGRREVVVPAGRSDEEGQGDVAIGRGAERVDVGPGVVGDGARGGGAAVTER